MLKCRHVSSRTVTSFFLSDFPPLDTKLLGLPIYKTKIDQHISFEMLLTFLTATNKFIWEL